MPEQGELLTFKEFADFLHLASPAVSEEVGAVLVPAFEMAKANPMRVAAVRADVDRARFRALVIAAGVSSHSRRFSIHIGGSEMVPLSQVFVLPHKEKVVLLTCGSPKLDRAYDLDFSTA